MLARVALVLFGCGVAALALGGAELLLRALDVGGDRHSDPFAGFSELVPKFELARLDDGRAIYRSVSLPGSNQLTFSAEKQPNAFRVFVVGGSSAAGVPYGREYAFGALLEKRLQAALPGIPIEVVNAAFSGYSSRRALVVVREIAEYEPDLCIVYSGHNESAERRFYGHLLEMDPRVFALREAIYSTRLYGLLSPLYQQKERGPRSVVWDDLAMANQMFAVGTKRVRGEDLPDAREVAYRDLHYRNNLEAMAREMEGAGAGVLLVGLSQDFADWEPGTSSNRRDLSPAELTRWDALYTRGVETAAEDCRAAIPVFEQALAIDDSFAQLHFELADCHRALGNPATAWEHYRLASDLDRVPFGAPTRFNRILREVAESAGLLYVDADSLLFDESATGLVGRNFFADLVHPNLRGHQLIASAIANELRIQEAIAPAAEWQADRYQDPSVETLLAERPHLLRAEHMIRAVACRLANLPRCVLLEAEAVLADNPGDEEARRLIEHSGRPERGLDDESAPSARP